ncbi:uncharacterized protein KQ657_001136 [Scheffersomyces spartinae]|uniref:Purine nucleoside permease n=1 Tax=Scheffersomyces spartinae TaxID=45513 RepID=A0A9P7V846_9ASCO|nr:uncharacterized protein KQ657_001136 [Scheffersomyces spartinae]KAG7193022.1 hypothetical protein KQ657_001136 [Scheffersomyces spartinae]
MRLEFLASAFLAATATAFPIFGKRSANTTFLEESVPDSSTNKLETSYGKPFAIFQPKVVIVSMFFYEQDPWLENMKFVNNITIPGLSPIYPDVHCTADYAVCQVTVGEGDINAAASMTALTLSPLFDFSKSYFMVAGIAGGEPQHVTLGSVTFAKYAIQGALEYEIAYADYHETNPDWKTGYFAYGTSDPSAYPENVYGTEVFELNEKLRDRAVELASSAALNNGTEGNAKMRELYEFEAAQNLPSVVKCDVMTSDNYYSGNTLGDYFAFWASLVTNGTATYCATAQEDNAHLEVLTRMTVHGIVDYDRVIVMRTISDFARPPPLYSNDTVNWFTNVSQGGSSASVANLYLAGSPIVNDILENWDAIYKDNTLYKSENYVGDLFNTLDSGNRDISAESFLIN